MNIHADTNHTGATASGTPGPWHISKVDARDYSDWSDAGGYQISAPGVEQICYVWNRTRRIPPIGPQSDGPEFGSLSGEADAKIIAAAPDLAAACEAMLALLMDGVLLNGPSSPILNEQRTKIFAMRALLNAGIDFGPRRNPFSAMENLSDVRAGAESREDEAA